MQVHELVRNVTSNTQVRSSSGSANDTHSCRSSAVGAGVAIEPTVQARSLPLMAGEFDDIRRRLETISEELADLAIERLRESIDAGGTELPVDERRLTRARRAVEKAIAVLRKRNNFELSAPLGLRPRRRWPSASLDRRLLLRLATPQPC